MKDGEPNPSECPRLLNYFQHCGHTSCRPDSADLSIICGEWGANMHDNACYRSTFGGFKFWANLARVCSLTLPCKGGLGGGDGASGGSANGGAGGAGQCARRDGSPAPSAISANLSN